jgi:flavin reductase (DIM6/NTAB) family NADH-FMN oxidoreductase RutF
MGISPHEFRHILSHFASGVTVVTTREPNGHPSGLTASAFASVSLDPPLVLVCVDRSAQSYPALLSHGRFAVNILANKQESLSNRFAVKRDDKFEGVKYQSGQLGLPVLDGALAVLECRTVHTYAGGDHTIFVGEVEAASAGSGSPLIYYRGQYDRLSS